METMGGVVGVGGKSREKGGKIRARIKMDEAWHSISYKGESTGSLISAEASAIDSSPWFSGHFPDEPILPGIAVLAMVTDVIREHASEKKRNIRISGIRRVRFRLPVKPAEVLELSLSFSRREASSSYHFRVELKGKTICTGIVIADALLEESGA